MHRRGMTGRRLVVRSLLYYWRTHLAAALGIAVGTAILTGSLVTGDSIRGSLRELARSRLGQTAYALRSPERFFRSSLADEMEKRLAASAAPVLRLSGIAFNNQDTVQINNVQVLGVDHRFWTLWEAGRPAEGPGAGEALVNQKLASRLGVRAGDEFVVRVERPAGSSRELPLPRKETDTTGIRVRVRAVIPLRGPGGFSLEASQIRPASVFFPRERLGMSTGLEDRANLILLAHRPGTPLSGAEVKESLRQCWRLRDAGLTLKPVEGGGMQLESNRVFLDRGVSRSGLRAGRFQGRGILTYLVNGIRRGGRSTPYSFVSAGGLPVFPPGMQDDEIVINRWLAGDLGAGEGDEISLEYYRFTPGGSLVEASSRFRVRAVVPLEQTAAGRDLMPPLPGLAEAETCGEWDPGGYIDLDRIRPEDEEYWERYRGTPKAFVTLSAGRRMWANQFGELTAIRYEAEPSDRAELENRLQGILDPAAAGLMVEAARRRALEAGRGSVDFGQLFLSLSFFLIAAALLLAATLLSFTIRQRSGETGTLLSLGFSTRLIRRLHLAEGGILAGAGCVLGAGLGVAYTRLILQGLNTIWRDAAGRAAIGLHARMGSIATGALAGLALAVLVVWQVSARMARRQPADLRAVAPVGTSLKSQIAGICFVLLACTVAWSVFAPAGAESGAAATARFFIAGVVVLAGCLALFNTVLEILNGSFAGGAPDIRSLGLRNCARRKGRSLAAAAILACGVFIVLAVGVNRKDPAAGADNRSSGTGGFDLMVETVIGIPRDLNSRDEGGSLGVAYGPDEGVSYVQFRKRRGSDASCLNLNKVQEPHILGVNAEELARRGAFSFVRTVDNGRTSASPWLLLKQPPGDGTVPAIADQTVIQWMFGKAVGDILSVVDEQGRECRLKLVASLDNSIFQGSVLIDETAFAARFPSVNGHRLLLVDAPGELAEPVSRNMARALRDFGPEIIRPSRRLAELYQVEKTYLSVFLILGGLGLLLGSAGLGIVVLRTVLEHRNELGLLRVLGFSRQAVRGVILWEHLPVLAVGLAAGTAAALVAVTPALSSSGAEPPLGFMLAALTLIAVNGVLWIMAATFWGTRGDHIPALRSE